MHAHQDRATAVCTYYVIIGGREAPPYRYVVKYIQQKQQQKQQRQQHQNLFWQFIQLNIPLPGDVKGLNIPLNILTSVRHL